MTTSPSDAVLTGAQEPRYKSIPPAATSAGADAVELAAKAGITLDPWQAAVLDGSMGERDEGWAAAEVALVVPRQNGKNEVAIVRELYGLFVVAEPLIVHSAHLFSTCKDHFRRLCAVIESSPTLRRRVKTIRQTVGEEGVVLTNGARIRFVARSRTSARGLTASTVVLDEAFALTDDQMSNMLPTLSASEGPQVWYLSSAPHLSSEVLRRVCLRGREGAPGLCYYEWCGDQSAESADVRAWLHANPALGYRLSLDFTAREMDALDDEDFRRERLGIWSEEHFANVIDLAVWRALADKDSKARDPVALAVDVTPDRKRAAIAGAGKRSDGLVHIEVIADREGVSWVVQRVAELVERHKPCAVMVDGRSPAASLLPALAEAGLKVTTEPKASTPDIIVTTSAAEMAAACGAFYDAIEGGSLRHLDQPELTSALEGATKRSLGEAWAFSRRGSTSIAPLVAATLALYGLAVHGSKPDPPKPMFRWA